MPTILSPEQIERLKREAKQVVRGSSLTHSQALDQQAVANGYPNWSLLMKHCAKTSLVTPPPFRFVRTQAEMQLALRKIPEPKVGLRIEAARSLVNDISHQLVSARNAVEFSIAYLECLLRVSRFKVYSAAPVYWEMWCWLPYEVKAVAGNVRILVNRNYKPIGQTTDAWADYAKFDHLHLALSQDQVALVSRRRSDQGYFFDDACPPWNSRRDAEEYLKKLRCLYSVIVGPVSGSNQRTAVPTI